MKPLSATEPGWVLVRELISTSASGNTIGPMPEMTTHSAGAAAAALDFQENYLRGVFGFLGITDIEFVRAEGIGMGPDQRAKAINDAHAEIGSRLPVAA